MIYVPNNYYFLYIPGVVYLLLPNFSLVLIKYDEINSEYRSLIFIFQ